MAFWAYAHPDYWQPRDLHDLYVYQDGTVIRVSLDGTSNDEVRALQAERLAIDANEMNHLADLVKAAGLTGGGLQPFVPLPDGVQIQDGGSVAFTARQGDVVTARVIDQLSSDGSYAVGDRVEFGRLLAALAPLCCEPRDDATVSAFSRWTIVSSPGASEVPYPEQEWTGPNLSDLVWVDIGNDTKCTIIDRTDWPLTLNERRIPQLVFDGRVITRRPLLPHEHDCNDVAAWRAILGL